MLDNLLNEYAERFNEAFPVFVAPDDENELIEILTQCLKENKRYKPKYEKDLIYG